jgi:hypothetical protein
MGSLRVLFFFSFCVCVSFSRLVVVQHMFLKAGWLLLRWMYICKLMLYTIAKHTIICTNAYTHSLMKKEHGELKEEKKMCCLTKRALMSCTGIRVVLRLSSLFLVGLMR